MATSTVRKVGGSMMLAVPPALLDVLRLSPGSKVDLSIDGGRLVVEPQVAPRYTLSELLDASDYSVATDEDAQWTGGTPVGNELI